MDVPSNVRSGGLRFAEQQMQRHGWTEGKGLGKREDGISEAIKVKVKCDTAGVGHNSAEQFTFHWWDHVFNKTASSIEVKPDQDGVKVKKLSEDDGGAVSSKKPRKAMLSRDMLYGRFIKSATLTSGGEKPVQDSSSSDTSDSSEDEDSRLDLSSATKLSDEDLVKICGGRTAHKGARHGLTMSAKLSRIEEQERAFMEKYGKKSQPSKSAAGEEINDKKLNKKKKQKEDDDCGEEPDNPSDSEAPRKKKKKKRRKGDCDESVEDGVSGQDQEYVTSMEEEAVTSKKKRRSRDKDNIEMSEEAEALSNHDDDLPEDDEDARPAKKKKKKKAVEPEESIMSNGYREDWGESAHENTGEATKSKKKKKKKDKRSEEERPSTPREGKVEETGEENGQYTEDRSRKKKTRVDNEDESQNGEDTKAKKKKKKSKTCDRD
ncbi:G patch domain-containing protein 4 [Dendropsophus ebraccatus]|uniref:G patch domain-containing protein 4 n=1 Tax=Dendropsophus ebraccatus TaxID=150705 RepID=UPI00383212FE